MDEKAPECVPGKHIEDEGDKEARPVMLQGKKAHRHAKFTLRKKYYNFKALVN